MASHLCETEPIALLETLDIKSLSCPCRNMLLAPETKRAVLASVNPLAQAGILQQVFAYLGPGHYYYVSTVSKGWLQVCERLGSITTRECYCDDKKGCSVTKPTAADDTLAQALQAPGLQQLGGWEFQRADASASGPVAAPETSGTVLILQDCACTAMCTVVN
jgi:hypothetical protein